MKKQSTINNNKPLGMGTLTIFTSTISQNKPYSFCFLGERKASKLLISSFVVDSFGNKVDRIIAIL